MRAFKFGFYLVLAVSTVIAGIVSAIAVYMGDPLRENAFDFAPRLLVVGWAINKMQEARAGQ